MSESVSITLHGTSDELDCVVDVLRVAAQFRSAVRDTLQRAEPSIKLLRLGQDDMRDEVLATMSVVQRLVASGETGPARCIGVVLASVGACDRPPPDNTSLQSWADRLSK